MPQTVRGADGTVHTFPDGVSPDDMATALRQYGDKQAAAAQQRAQAASDSLTSIKANAGAGVTGFLHGLTSDPLAGILHPGPAIDATKEAISHPSEIGPAIAAGASDPEIFGRAMGGATQSVGLRALPSLIRAIPSGAITSGLGAAADTADEFSNLRGPKLAASAKILRKAAGLTTPAATDASAPIPRGLPNVAPVDPSVPGQMGVSREVPYQMPAGTPEPLSWDMSSATTGPKSTRMPTPETWDDLHNSVAQATKSTTENPVSADPSLAALQELSTPGATKYLTRQFGVNNPVAATEPGLNMGGPPITDLTDALNALQQRSKLGAPATNLLGRPYVPEW